MKLASDEREDAILPVPDEIMDVWSMSKDGKMWHSEEKKPDCDMCEDKIRCLTDETYKDFHCRQWWRYQWYQKAMRK